MSTDAEPQDIQDGVEAHEVAAVDTPAEQVAEQQVEPAEDKARRLGWKPKDEYTGPEGKWVDAAEFVRRGEESPTLLRKNNEALERQVKNLRDDLKKVAGQMGQFQKRAYEQAVKDIEARHAAAVDEGDRAAALDAANELADLKREVDSVSEPEGSDPDEKAALDEFKARNPWMGKDNAMTAYAVALSNDLARRGIDGKEQLEEVERQMRAAFPAKFTRPRPAVPAVEGQTPSRPRTKGFIDLPADAKAMAQSFAKRGVMTVEEYAKDFFAAEAK
jgi:hypothetical protein